MWYRFWNQGLNLSWGFSIKSSPLVRADDCLKELLVNDYNGISYQSKEALIKNIKALREDQASLLSLKANTRSSTINYTDKIFAQRILEIYQDLLNK